jgi:hypothetical protein
VALVAGLLFLAVGAFALIAGHGTLVDALRWIWPVTLLAVGTAMLVRSGKHRPSDEVGAERRQYR